MDEEDATKLIEKWTKEGSFTPERILQSLDERIEQYHAIGMEEEPVLKHTFNAYCTRKNGGEPQLTEAAFISVLQTKAFLPRSLEGVQAGHIIYSSIAYLSTMPLQRSSPLPSLSLEHLTRGLVWTLPCSYQRIFEESSWTRARTPADQRRMIFQSLATTTHGKPWDPAEARQHSLANAMDVDDLKREYAGPNYDDDGDETFHDVLDVLYSVQPERLPYADVKRDGFRPVARNLVGKDQILLRSLAIPMDRFVALVRVLLPLQFDPTTERAAADYSHFHEAALSVAAAFCEDAGSRLITWPVFDHAMKNITPYLFESLYRLFTHGFFDKGSTLDTFGAFTAPSTPGSILTLPLLAQLTTMFAQCTWIDDGFRRVRHYEGLSGRPTPAALAREMRDVSEGSIMVFSGLTVPAGEMRVFGVFSPRPALDGSEIQYVADTARGPMIACTVFQLSPVQDVFQGAVGRPGWTVGDGCIRFGQGGGVEMVLGDGLRRAEVRHSSAGLADAADTCSFHANKWRGSWAESMEILEIEIWAELMD